ncbi:MAG: response regulator [Candidatus Omnitrophica bacterium]|nr:response regulator [Candidatus Omnitrophota bacterium]
MKNKKILICDDEEGIRESYRLILEDDYSLIFAQDGIKAVEEFKKQAFDLVILDIKIPKKDGLEVLKEIKAIKPGSNVLVITGYQSASIAEETIKLGATNYLPKPFEKNQLRKAIQTII